MKTSMSVPVPYHVFEGGLSVILLLHNQEGTWHPPVILPYFWKDNALWVCCSRPEIGYDKAIPITSATKWPDYTDFFIVGGVMLWAYAKVDGYLPVYLEDLKGIEAILATVT